MASSAAKYSNLSGVLFRQLGKSKGLAQRHALDTNLHRYHDTLERVVVPQCFKIAPDLPSFHNRLKEVISFHEPVYGDAWSFSVELIYRTVAENAHKTEESITKMYILRGVMDLMLKHISAMEDCAGNSSGKSWSSVCPGGRGAAVYDGMQLSILPRYILRQNFRDHPDYTRMLEMSSLGLVKVLVGQTIDLVGRQKSLPSMDDYNHILHYKTGQYFSIGPCLALIYAGIRSEELISKTKEVFSKMSELIQIADDFNNYYSLRNRTGTENSMKPGTTWLNAAAMEKLTSFQIEEFKRCYASKDPASIQTLCELFDEIEMPQLYVEHMTTSYQLCKKLIEQLPHEKVREASSSYLEWLVGQD